MYGALISRVTLLHLCGFVYIVVAINYVSKCVEALTTMTSDDKVVVKFVKEYIFYRCGTLRVLINDGGNHFCH